MVLVLVANVLSRRPEPGAGEADGGGPPAAGAAPGGAEPLLHITGQSQQPADGQMLVAAAATAAGRVHGLRAADAVQLSGKQSVTGPGTDGTTAAGPHTSPPPGLTGNSLFHFQEEVDAMRETMAAAGKKSKRHLDREGSDAGGGRRKDKKQTHKRQKMNKKNPQHRATSTSSSPRSDFSQSDDSDEEMAVCPAERCQLPEGDEVRHDTAVFVL